MLSHGRINSAGWSKYYAIVITSTQILRVMIIFFAIQFNFPNDTNVFDF